MTTDPLHVELSSLLKPVGQEHVLRWWAELSPGEKEALAVQVRGMDLARVNRLARSLRVEAERAPRGGPLQPPPIRSLAAMDAVTRRAAREEGERAIRAGQVACYMVAGGQATRLGIDGPKGTVEVGPVSRKSLFRLHAEKILAASIRYSTEIPWLLLTSDATDRETREFFEREGNFGLGPAQVRFLLQGSLPAFTPDGRILMKTRSEIFMGPDGHGGAIHALSGSGLLDDLLKEGTDVLSYFQVDNPLAPPIDPVFIGLHRLEGAEVSSKVAEKTDPEEKVGVFALRDGSLTVVEYTEISDEDRLARVEGGRLKFRGGNLAIHVMSLSFLDRLREEGLSLPHHPARKIVPALDEAGRPTTPSEPNGVKFESFIFDAIPLARTSFVAEVVREDEFQPIKNAAGKFTLEDARQALSRLHARWLAGVVEVPSDASGSPSQPVEISPMYALDEEELRSRVPPDLQIEGPLYLSPEPVPGE
ncbi:MAG: UDPGP type 1 family protein [Planctomycetota bacterium]|nr:UDPGP type 1 family protein [Planctomycetota bacterium]